MVNLGDYHAQVYVYIVVQVDLVSDVSFYHSVTSQHVKYTFSQGGGKRMCNTLLEL